MAADAILVVFVAVWRHRHRRRCCRRVLVAPATVALAAIVIALAVVATTFLTIDAGLIFDCRVPLPSSSDVADVTTILSTNVVEAGHVRARRKFVFWFSWI